jgi:hypothetical protein
MIPSFSSSSSLSGCRLSSPQTAGFSTSYSFPFNPRVRSFIDSESSAILPLRPPPSLACDFHMISDFPPTGSAPLDKLNSIAIHINESNKRIRKPKQINSDSLIASRFHYLWSNLRQSYCFDVFFLISNETGDFLFVSSDLESSLNDNRDGKPKNLLNQLIQLLSQELSQIASELSSNSARNLFIVSNSANSFPENLNCFNNSKRIKFSQININRQTYSRIHRNLTSFFSNNRKESESSEINSAALRYFLAYRTKTNSNISKRNHSFKLHCDQRIKQAQSETIQSIGKELMDNLFQFKSGMNSDSLTICYVFSLFVSSLAADFQRIIDPIKYVSESADSILINVQQRNPKSENEVRGFFEYEMGLVENINQLQRLIRSGSLEKRFKKRVILRVVVLYDNSIKEFDEKHWEFVQLQPYSNNVIDRDSNRFYHQTFLSHLVRTEPNFIVEIKNYSSIFPTAVFGQINEKSRILWEEKVQAHLEKGCQSINSMYFGTLYRLYEAFVIQSIDCDFVVIRDADNVMQFAVGAPDDPIASLADGVHLFAWMEQVLLDSNNSPCIHRFMDCSASCYPRPFLAGHFAFHRTVFNQLLWNSSDFVSKLKEFLLSDSPKYGTDERFLKEILFKQIELVARRWKSSSLNSNSELIYSESMNNSESNFGSIARSSSCFKFPAPSRIDSIVFTQHFHIGNLHQQLSSRSKCVDKEITKFHWDDLHVQAYNYFLIQNSNSESDLDINIANQNKRVSPRPLYSSLLKTLSNLFHYRSLVWSRIEMHRIS